jgi:sulfoxide reductase catalytic subunit YedY
MDEAMNPLTLLTSASTATSSPTRTAHPSASSSPGNTASNRAKSIVQIKFVANSPPPPGTSPIAPAYGFYSNVNPNADPWRSQKTERRIGQPFYAQIHPTLMFNGYGDFR